jgi:hypothetical protein
MLTRLCGVWLVRPQEVVGYMQEPKVLKEKVKTLYQKHCGELTVGPAEDGDAEREAARQREYLEKTVRAGLPQLNGARDVRWRRRAPHRPSSRTP